MSENTVRRKHRSFRRGLLAFAALLAAVIAAALFALPGREIPLHSWISAQIENRVNAGMASGTVDIGRTNLIIGTEWPPSILLGDVTVSDATGLPIAEMEQIEVMFSPGRLRPVRMKLHGAAVTLRREPDGRFDLSFRNGEGPSGQAKSLGDILNDVEAVFDTPALSQMRIIEARDSILQYEDARAARFWETTDAEATLERDDDKIGIRLRFGLNYGGATFAESEVAIESFRDSSRAMLAARISRLPAADFSSQAPALAWLSAIDAPVSGSVLTQLDDQGALEAMNGTLEIGEGSLRSAPQTGPMKFKSAHAHFGYDPVSGRVRFDELSLRTDVLVFKAEGHAYPRDTANGWPQTILGQFRLREISASPGMTGSKPITFDSGALDLRLRLDPFVVSIGQLVLINGRTRIAGNGEVSAGRDGWMASLDATADWLTPESVIALWPENLVPNTREWISDNVLSGTIHDVSASLRAKPGQEPVTSLSFKFTDATVRYLNTLPVVTDGSGFASIHDRKFSLSVERGLVTAPNGGEIDVADTHMEIADIMPDPARLDVNLSASGDIAAALSLLDEPPLEIMKKAEVPVDIAQGRVNATAQIGFDLIRDLRADEVDFRVQATLRDVSSDRVVEGKQFRADSLSLRASNESIEISGPVELGQVSARAAWIRRLDPEAGGASRIEGTVELSSKFLDEFGIDLPDDSMEGVAVGRIEIGLERGAPPRFTLRSDLNRLKLNLASLGWSKPANRIASFFAKGELGPPLGIEELRLNAQDLEVEGAATFNDDGSLDVLRFGKVRAGEWLDAPVVLTGRGKGQPPGIAVAGGSMDLREARLGREGTAAARPGGPITAALDRIVVSDGLLLTNFRGNFVQGAGLNGRFSADLNERARVAGELFNQPNGTALRIRSDDAGATMAAIGILERARGGTLDLALVPLERDGVYDGQLMITDSFSVNGAPALAELLGAISVIGLLEQLDGNGLVFGSAEARFRLTQEQLVFSSASATGPSLGVSLNGFFDLTNRQLDMQGVISPVYLVNRFGALLSRRGEGLFGFNFHMLGAASDPEISVNPLSILTPGVFREIFRRSPPELPE